MAHRINERNTGNWTLEGEPKKRTAAKRINKSFTLAEIQLFKYLMGQISDNIALDASDLDNQVFRDNGNILVQFSRDDAEDFRTLRDKFNN